MLLRNGDGDQDGLIALGGIVENDADNSPYAQQYFAGLLDRGFWHARPEDTVAFLFTYIAMCGTLGKVRRDRVQTHELVLEANCHIHIYRARISGPNSNT